MLFEDITVPVISCKRHASFIASSEVSPSEYKSSVIPISPQSSISETVSAIFRCISVLHGTIFLSVFIFSSALTSIFPFEFIGILSINTNTEGIIYEVSLPEIYSLRDVSSAPA